MEDLLIMKSKLLTARKAESLKPESGAEFARDYPDGAVPGLSLVLHPTGRKSWALRYRIDGRQRRLTLGRYPRMKLAKARKEAIEKLKAVDRGEDPAEAKKETAAPDTVGGVVSEFVTRYLKPRNKSWQETERILLKETEKWKHRPAETIKRADVLNLLDKIMDRGTPYMANRTHAALSRLFSWAAERGHIEVSPLVGVRAPGEETSRDRVLTDGELAEIWNAAEGLGYPLGPFYQVVLLTAQRRGDAAGMRWQDLDLENGLWTLQAAQTKAGRIHDVPLSGPVLELLERLPRFEGEYVWTTTSGEKPINGFGKAFKRINAAILEARKKDNPQAKPIEDWKVHDLRRSAATHMAKANVPPHVLAAILNHSPGRTMGISAVYIRHKYASERREALEAWAGHVMELAKPERHIDGFMSAPFLGMM